MLARREHRVPVGIVPALERSRRVALYDARRGAQVSPVCRVIHRCGPSCGELAGKAHARCSTHRNSGTAVLGAIQSQVSDAVWRTWFSGVHPVGLVNGTFVLSVPNALVRERLETRFSGVVQAAVVDLAVRSSRSASTWLPTPPQRDEPGIVSGSADPAACVNGTAPVRRGICPGGDSARLGVTPSRAS